MAKKRMRGVEPRTIWSTNLAPLVTAARDGAAQAAQTAGKERARARRKSQWWRRRWLVVSAAGLAVAGAAGGVYRAVTKRQAASESAPEQTEAGKKPGGSTPTETIMSTVETGREKVTEAARTMLHKIRRDEPDGDGAATPAGKPASTVPDEMRNQSDPTRR